VVPGEELERGEDDCHHHKVSVDQTGKKNEDPTYPAPTSKCHW
jgi:hypothetical protein